MKYHLEVNENQLRLIQDALDLHSRILLGQFEEVGNVANTYSVNMLGEDHSVDKEAYEYHHKFTDAVREIKQILGFHSNGSYGIFNPEVHDDSRNAYDIIQVIRNYFAEKIYKDGDSRMFVSFDTPHKTGTYDLPIISEIKNKE